MGSHAATGPAKKYLSHTLSEWACGLKFEHLSEKAVHTAKLFWCDSLGCALAAHAPYMASRSSASSACGARNPRMVTVSGTTNATR